MSARQPPDSSVESGGGFLSNLLSNIIFILIFCIYQVGWYVLSPLVILRLVWRSRKESDYLKQIPERFGFYSTKPNRQAVWIHAVSVGETRAAQPLIDALIKNSQTVLLTHMTPTGRRTGAELFKPYIESDKLVQAYLPYDFLGPVNRFYRAFDLKMGAIMETEAWPTLVFFAKHVQFPLYLVNGRLSERSARRVRRFGSLGRRLFQSFVKILAQTVSDEQRYKSLGVTDISVTGNLKFDVPLNQDLVMQGKRWRDHSFAKRPVVCLASSREGEEVLFLRACKSILDKAEVLKPLLMIIPRHPTRFSEVADLITREGYSVVKRSMLNDETTIDADVILGDSMGEMPRYLAAADLVVMGGSLLPFGGQNLIEPCSIGKPVVLGQHTFNFLEASKDAIEAGAAWRLPSKEVSAVQVDLYQKLDELLSHSHLIDEASRAALLFARTYAGATEKTIAALAKHF